MSGERDNAVEQPPKLVVGIGASAGGLESLENFFETVPIDSGLAFVVIQHLSPDFKSLMDELLSRRTRLQIRRAEEGMPVKADHIYLLPPKKEMIIAKGRLHLTDKDPKADFTLPIDHFFRSLAQDCGRRAVAIVLSGTGSDGSRGIKDIHEADGLVISQDEESAKFDGMPRSAVETGYVDRILRPDEMADVLLHHAEARDGTDNGASRLGGPPLEGIAAVFDLLRRQYNLDFSHYKPTTVSRRLERRLTLGRDDSLDAYVERLREDPLELNSLYKDLLIGVTKFFRDREPFEKLESLVIPKAIENLAGKNEIRVWAAGCATGEEAYSLAILFHEAIEKAELNAELKLFATDVHKQSLLAAGQGVFQPEQLSELSPARLDRFFTRRDDGFHVTQALRQSIVFAQHNVIKDAPFTNLDLISCRNLLIYLLPPAQKRAMSLFHFGLKTGGVLMLGSSESTGDLGDEFDVIDHHCKLFVKRRDIRLSSDLRLPLSAGAARDIDIVSRQRGSRSSEVTIKRIHGHLLDRFMPPSFIVNRKRELIETFGGAESYLRIKGRHLSHDLLDLLDTDARTAIAGALARVMQSGKSLSFTGVRLGTREPDLYRMEIELIGESNRYDPHYLITFHPLQPDENRARAKEVKLGEVSDNAYSHMEDELRHTKENLQATIEELETSNEEMQATNQELVASNEELQSTNEELHSVNEELYTVNSEHQQKIRELIELHRDVEHLLRSTPVAIIFLDRHLRIRKFTPQVADIFDLVEADIGRRLSSFANKLRYQNLPADLEAVFENGIARELEVRTLDGVCYLMKILPYREGKSAIEGAVVSFVDISSLDVARGRIAHLSSIVESSADAIISMDLKGKIITWNQSAAELYGYCEQEAVDSDISLIIPDDGLIDKDERLALVGQGTKVAASEVQRVTKSGERIFVSLTISPIHDSEGTVVGASSISRDITDRKRLQEAQARLAAIVTSSDDAIISKTLDGIVTSWNKGAERMYGYSAEEMIGQSIRRIIPPKKLDEFQSILQHLREDRQIPNYETLRITKKGEQLEVLLSVSAIRDETGKVVGGSTIAHDITQLNQIQQERKSTQRRYELAVSASNVGIWEWEPDSNGFLSTKEFTRLLGYNSGEFENSIDAFKRQIHPDDRDRVWRAINAHLQNPESQYSQEFRMMKKDGSIRWFRGCGNTGKIADGDKVRFVGTLSDIHWRREAQLRSQAEVRQRDIFLAMLSHELRNPLSAVRNASQLLKSDQTSEAVTSEARQVIDRQTQHMTRLLDDLLDVSRITRDKITLSQETIDFREAVDESIEAVQPMADAREVTIRRQVPAEAVIVNGDRTRLEQVVTNLLANAIKYSSLKQSVTVCLRVEGTHAVVTVTDSGAGMSPELIESIFDLFVQADKTLDRSQGGIGVGLTLVRKLVELHGGKVMARSEGLGKGSEFEVRVPLDIRNEKRLPGPHLHAVRASRAKHVLLVEDQDDNREMLKGLLELEGLKVDDTSNGPQALQFLSTHDPDVAIIDIGLPEMDGYEVARRIRQLPDKKIRLIAFTGYGQPQDVAKAKDAGFDEHLVKPLQTNLLYRLLGLTPITTSKTKA